MNGLAEGPAWRDAPAAWYATDPSILTNEDARAELERALTNNGTRGSAARTLLERIEAEVAKGPERCFSFDHCGAATLTAGGQTFRAGRFTTPTIAELRARIGGSTTSHTGVESRVRLSVLHGGHLLTDIGTLQATAPPETLFQAASQFNCLEAPGSHITPVLDYLGDSTQGPRASISAFPATLLRHYQAPAPDGSRFTQTDARCLDLLADAIPPDLAKVHSGYLRSTDIRDKEKLAAALTDHFERIRIGVHDDVQVVFGHDWDGPVPTPEQRIAQVFTSTLALGGYSPDDGSTALAAVRRQILRGAYVGTLLAAVDLGKHTAVLTMIGGGVFGNPHRDIWDAIHWAIGEVEALGSGPMTVLVNTREKVAESDREKVRACGGVFVEFGGRRIVVER